jgi:N utilization substance protein B
MTEVKPANAPEPQKTKVGRPRTAARLAAVQALYQIDVTGVSPSTVVLEINRHNLPGNAPDESFGDPDAQMFSDIVTGASARREDIDRGISAVLTPDWPLERLEIILRAILRAGAYELLAAPKVPTRVVISEYLEIAHAFFEGKEPGLVNGVLDRLARQVRPESFKDDEAGAAASR